MDDLSIHIFSAKNPSPDFANLHNKVYMLWKEVWISTFKELGERREVTGDEFMRQDKVLALCAQNEVVGVSLFNKMDLRLECHLDNSYFKPFPREILLSLRDKGVHDVLIGSNFTLNHRWRHMKEPAPLKEIFFGTVIKYFMESSSPVMVGTMRKDRGMEKVAYRYGAEPLVKDVPHYHVLVDLVLFDKKKVHLSDLDKSSFFVNQLWNQATSEWIQKAA